MKNYIYPSPIIAERIQKIFDENKIKDVDIVAALGCERKTISSYRYAQTNPSIKFIRYLCSTYHIDANWLLDLKGG